MGEKRKEEEGKRDRGGKARGRRHGEMPSVSLMPLPLAATVPRLAREVGPQGAQLGHSGSLEINRLRLHGRENRTGTQGRRNKKRHD